MRSRRWSLRFLSRCTCNTSDPGECCNAEIAASRSRCSCCKRASCSRNSRSSSLVIATADSTFRAPQSPKSEEKYPCLAGSVQAGEVDDKWSKAGIAALHNENRLRGEAKKVYTAYVRQQSDVRRTPQHVHASPSCGTGTAAPGPGSGNY